MPTVMFRSSEIQQGRGGISFPQTPVVALCWEHAAQYIQKVSIQTTHSCSVLGPKLFSDRLASPPFVGM